MPVISRREASPTSARSLLMTVLGEYVLPRDRPVWTSALVSALALVGAAEKSARQALARTAADGWLAPERVGRRVRWVLTASGRRLLSEGAKRIYDFGAGERPWDGTWLLLLVSVPESGPPGAGFSPGPRERAHAFSGGGGQAVLLPGALRHRVRTRLSWAGFGSPEAGVWISPYPDREAEALSVLKELGLAATAMSFSASYGAVGSEDAMVARAWDLAELRTRYEDFIGEFGPLRPETGDAVLRAQTRLVHRWRRFPFLDPQLPHELLPPNWSGSAAAELFHRRRAEWAPSAQRRWDELASEPPST